MRKTKIICTMGPSTKDPAVLRQMLKSGMNVARMNFSHGNHEEHRENIERFRAIRDELGIPAAVLLDTRGPEIRIKNFKNGEIDLADGEIFRLVTFNVEGDDKQVSVTYKDLPKEVAPGNMILINDGKIMLQVIETGEDFVCGKVVHGGKLSNHKGINLPNVNLQMEYLSQQDKSDLLFGIEMDVDFVAASFIRTAGDVKAVKEFLASNGGEKIKIISKIESTQGVENFDEILEISDGIMIARGDMGVEVAYERLPGIQKRFINKCVEAGKIVITATQMLESMITSPVPTRAEITDVANAVYDGTSAVMLSGETAAGAFPVEAVKTMATIAKRAELDSLEMGKKEDFTRTWNSDITNAVGHAACTLATDIKAGAIMAITKTGYTAQRMSKYRPEIQIIGATPYPKTYHQMAILWGVRPLLANYRDDMESLFGHCVRKAMAAGMVQSGEYVVCSAGIPMDISGNTNMIRVSEVE